MVLSYAVSEIRRLLAENLLFFLPLSYLAPTLPMFPFELHCELNGEKTGVMGLLNGESCLILTFTVFDCSTM